MSTPLLRLPGLAVESGWPPSGCAARLHQRPGVPGEPQVFALALPATPEEWIQGLLPVASPGRRVAAARFGQPLDALRCLASEALLRHAAKALLGQEPELDLTVGPFGKPAFLRHPEVHFNLSHSGPWLLCALHDAPVGVDVEQESSRALAAAPTFMSVEELGRHRQLPPDQTQADFFRLWTRKESLLKAAGTGLSRDPRAITLAPGGVSSGPPPPPGMCWVLEDVPLPPGARAALCFAAPRPVPAE